MSLSRRLALVAVVSSLTLPALAADPAPAPKSAAKGGAAKADAPPKPEASELARVLMPKKTWDEGLAALTKNVKAQMTSHPGAQLDYPADLEKQIRAELNAALPYEALLELHAKELSAGYSEGELADLLAFYRTPTGQKSLQVMPQVTDKIALQTQQRVESKMPAIFEKLAGKMKKPSGKGQAGAGPHGGMPAGHGGGMPAGHGSGMPAGHPKPSTAPAAPAK